MGSTAQQSLRARIQHTTAEEVELQSLLRDSFALMGERQAQSMMAEAGAASFLRDFRSGRGAGLPEATPWDAWPLPCTRPKEARS